MFFLDFTENQTVTWDIPNFFRSTYRTRKCMPQEVPPYSIGKLIFPYLFDETNDTKSQDLLQLSIEQKTPWAIAGGLPDKEKQMPKST